MSATVGLKNIKLVFSELSLLPFVSLHHIEHFFHTYIYCDGKKQFSDIYFFPSSVSKKT